MSETIRSLIERYELFYEVVPHRVIRDRVDGSHRTLETIQSGFEVCVYGVNPDSRLTMPPPDHYARGFLELRRLTERVSTETARSCVIDVMPFPSKIILNVRGFAKVTAVFHIRISHWGDGAPAGPAEARALETLTHELEALGIARR